MLSAFYVNVVAAKRNFAIGEMAEPVHLVENAILKPAKRAPVQARFASIADEFRFSRRMP